MQLQFVSDQGDELGIGGLALGIADRIPEKSLQRVQIPSVPCYLNGVADGTLYPGRRGLECLGHLGVQYLGDGIDHIHIFHRDDDGFPQVLIALDVGGHTDLVDDARNHGFDAGLFGWTGGGCPTVLPSADLHQPFHELIHITGLQHQIPRAQAGGGGCHIVGNKSRCGQHSRSLLHGGYSFQYADPILFGQHQVQDQNIGPMLLDHAEGLLTVRGCAYDLKAACLLQSGGKVFAEFLRIVCDQNGGIVVHNFLS